MNHSELKQKYLGKALYRYEIPRAYNDATIDDKLLILEKCYGGVITSIGRKYVHLESNPGKTFNQDIPLLFVPPTETQEECFKTLQYNTYYYTWDGILNLLAHRQIRKLIPDTSRYRLSLKEWKVYNGTISKALATIEAELLSWKARYPVDPIPKR